MASFDPADAIGGPLGRRSLSGARWRPAPLVYLAGTLSWIILMLRQLPCRGELNPPYENLCYTDIVALWYARGLNEGKVPYLQSELEYPVLTGFIMELGRRWVALLGGASEPGASSEAMQAASEMFFGLTAVLMFVFFLGLLAVHLRLGRPWDAMLIAASPLVMADGLINWDMLVVFLTSASLLWWAQRRPVGAGVVLGLAVAAKLYPLLLLVPLFVLCLRIGRLRDFWLTLAGAAASWLAVNLPVAIAAPDGWMVFWTFNADRGVDLGSIWYALSLTGFEVKNVSLIVAAIMVIGTALICALLLLAPRRPRLAQGVFLVVVLFCLVNKVYSPQYALWLLPLLVLANPRIADHVLFTLSELFYYAAIWYFLGGSLNSGDGQPRLYWTAVFVRSGVQLWLAGRVAWDMFHPHSDPIRRGVADDPGGGVLDQAPDAPWLARLVQRA